VNGMIVTPLGVHKEFLRAGAQYEEDCPTAAPTVAYCPPRERAFTLGRPSKHASSRRQPWAINDSRSRSCVSRSSPGLSEDRCSTCARQV
jgi:hypothetical protein